MRYGFINNFSQALAADLAAGATTMTLDGGGASITGASADYVYSLTLDDGEGNREIVYVTAVTGNDLTIVRAQEGTTAQAWPTGTTVENRITAASVDILGWQILDGSESAEGFVTALGSFLTYSGLNEGVIIGNYTSATGSRAVVVGSGSEYHTGGSQSQSILVGAYSKLSGSNSIMAGTNSDATADRSIYIGNGIINYFAPGDAGATPTDNAIIGHQIWAEGSYNAIVGAIASAASNDYVASLGYDTAASASRTSLMGPFTQASGEGGVAIGDSAKCGIPGGLACNALSFVPAVYTHPAGSTVPNATRQASQQVVLVTDPLDLTDGTAAVTLDMPAGARLFMDSIDVVITGSNTPGGTPQITVGPDDVTPAAYLAATTVAKTAVGERETHTPLVRDGVTSLRVAVSTAGTGTTYTAKVVFRGYVMEL